MQLPAKLRLSLQDAFVMSYGRPLSNENADALGRALITFYWEAANHHVVIHRSNPSIVDEGRNKRDAGGEANV